MKERLIPLLIGLTLFGFGLAAPAAYATSCASGHFCGTIYFTTYGGGGGGSPCPTTACVGSVTFDYDSIAHVLSLGSVTVIANGLPHGSDGLVFDPQTGDLIAGENDCSTPYQAYEINPSTGAIVQMVNTATPAFHLMVDPTGTTLWASSDSGSCGVASPASVGMSSSSPYFSPPSSLSLSGSDTTLSELMWLPSDSVHAYYTSDPSPTQYGGFGHFGTVNLSTGVTQCIQDVTGGCHDFQAAHGGAYDPYTGDMIIFGSSEVTQIATTPTPLSLTNVVGNYAASVSSNLDQGSADGFGHLFIADNSGQLFFEDYAASSNVGSPTYATAPFLISNLDDLAPIVGPGSSTGVPQFPLGIAVLIGLSIPLLVGIRASKLRTRVA